MWRHIFEAIALILGAGVFVVQFLKNRSLQSDNDLLVAALQEAEEDLMEAEKELTSSNNQARANRSLFESTNDELETTKAELVEAVQERQNALPDLATMLARADGHKVGDTYHQKTST